ncbi:MAG: hypothetical protein NTX25_01725 [Proteobacteria bacterium]|nr:hypothetical protein [Pseudomonadota bacterium]
MKCTLVRSLISLTLLSSPQVFARTYKSLDCYEKKQGPGPIRIKLEPSPKPGDAADSFELWCYAALGNGETLIFNADHDRIRAELSILFKEGGNSSQDMVTYGSLSRGELKIIRQAAGAYLPAISLRAETAAKQGLRKSLSNSFELETSLDSVLSLFHGQALIESVESPLQEGNFAKQLADELLPYKAYWWPHEGVPLAAGPYSPLGKYDAAVTARTGRNPLASDWELKYHSLQNVEWGGHCNGWAASSILYRKLPAPLWDRLTQNVFQVSDIEGILAEASFCVQWTFFGNRNNAGPHDDPTDIRPDLFHKVLRHYIDVEEKPIAFDYEADESVDNNIISGYDMTITKDPTIPKQFRVDLRVRQHYYAYHRKESQGVASSFINPVYAYTLRTDDQGAIIGGTWLSENPDFLWVPLAQKRCGRENPSIDENFVSQTLMNLPAAQLREQTLEVPKDIVLKAGESRIIFQGDLHGSDFKLNFPLAHSLVPLNLQVKGAHRYPFLEEEDLLANYDFTKSSTFAIPAIVLRTIEIQNQGTEPVSLELLGSGTLSYLGGD